MLQHKHGLLHHQLPLQEWYIYLCYTHIYICLCLCQEQILTYHNMPKFKCTLEIFLGIVCSMGLDGLDFLISEAILFLDLTFTIIFLTVTQRQSGNIFQTALEHTSEEINIS